MKFYTSLKEVFGADLRTLALFRICLGFLLIADLINRVVSLSAHYSDNGVLPRALVMQEMSLWRFSLHNISGSAFFELLLFLVAAIIAIALLVGYRTRLATVLSWILLVSLQNRNHLVLQGGDNLFALLLFWAMFLPLGARYSIDAVRRPLILAASNHYFSIASVALKVQCMSVYFFGAIIKYYSSSWVPDGTAIYYALSIDQLVSPAGVWLRDFSPVLLTFLTRYVWFLQMFGSLLMLSPIYYLPLRYLMMFAFISMHASFIVFMEIGLFPYISIASLLAFTPAAFWDWAADKLKRRQKIQSIHCNSSDSGIYFLVRSLQLFTFHWHCSFRSMAEIELAPTDSRADRFAVVDNRKQVHRGWHAVLFFLKSSIIFIPVYWLLNNKLAQLLILSLRRIIANRLFRVWNFPNKVNWIDEKAVWDIAEKKLAAVIVGFLAIILFYWNIVTLPQNKWTYPKIFYSITKTLRLDQRWNMFAPSPLRRDGWYVIKGRLADGTPVDVFRMQPGEPLFDKPANIHAMYGNQRWTKYYMNLARNRNKSHLLYFGRYLCQKSRGYFNGERELARFEVYFNVERTLARKQEFQIRKPGIKRVRIWNHYCRNKYKNMHL